MPNTILKSQAPQAAKSIRSAKELEGAWKSLLEAEPRLRIRDAAARLNVSEMELLALNCGGLASRLRPNWAELLSALAPLGELMALTRNDHAVHERLGCYRNLKVSADRSSVRGEELGLRLFLDLWRHGFAVTESAPGTERHSLQFFDQAGAAVHKIYLTERSHCRAYEDLVELHAAADQSLPQMPAPGSGRTLPSSASGSESPPEAAGSSGSDLHLLQRPPTARRSGLHSGAPENARRVADTGAEHVLQAAARSGLPIAVSVGSPGAIQTYRGAVHNIRRTGPWLNVLAAGFNLHLRDNGADCAWVIRTEEAGDGRHALELYAADGAAVIQLRCALASASKAQDFWNSLLDDLLPATTVEAESP